MPALVISLSLLGKDLDHISSRNVFVRYVRGASLELVDVDLNWNAEPSNSSSRLCFVLYLT